MNNFTPSLAELDTLRREIEIACRAISPVDLHGWPIYLVWSSQIESEFPGWSLYGCALNSLDLLAKPYLRWEGRGPCFMLNDRAVASDAANCIGYRLAKEHEARGWFMATIWETALHEFAHVLDRGTERHATPSDAMMLKIRDVLRDGNAGNDPPAPPVALDADHGPRWMRAAIHCTWRHNQQRNRTVCYADVLRTDARGLSQGWDYFGALEGEPERLADQSFQQILSTPLPAAFAELWRCDIARIEQAAA